MSSLPIEVQGIYIEALSYKFDNNSEKPIELKFEVQTAVNEECDTEYMVVLDATSSKTGQALDLSCKVRGYFEVSPDLPEDKRIGLVKSAGASLCYSHLREQVESMCSRVSPHIHLPVMTFTHNDSQKNPDSREE